MTVRTLDQSPAAGALDQPSTAAEWTLADLFIAFARRRLWILSSLILCSILATLAWLCATPRYQATAVIEVQKESHGDFGLDHTTADTPTTAVNDSFDDNLTLQTEIGILQSDAVALDVFRRTRLETTPDYFAPRQRSFAWLHHFIFWSKPLEPLSTPLADAPNRRYVALKIFAKHAKVAPTPGTRLISIGYSDPDPQRAAAVVDALVQSLADESYESQSSTATQSASWLQSQLTGLKEQTEALDARAAALDREAGAFGDDDTHNVVLARLDDLNAALSAAQASRIVREAIWRAVQGGDPEAISGLGGNSAAGVNTQNSFALLQSLRAQESAAKSQIAESAGRYGENWPALAEQRAGLATIQKSVQDEVHRLGDRAHSDYEVSLQAENAARDAFNQQKEVASRLTGNAVALRLARQQAAESRSLYTSLLGRLQQAGVLEGLHSGNFVVVSPPLVPPADHPTSPSVPLLAALALAGGLTLGCSAAIVRELTDEGIHSLSDLESLSDTPIVAALPAQQPAQLRISQWLRPFLPAPEHADMALEASAASDFAFPAPSSPYVEALHRLRADLMLPSGDRPPQIIVVTPASDHGPTHPSDSVLAPVACLEDASPSLALNLAAVLAQYGAPVLYVDADLRLAPCAGASPVVPGLSDVLTGDLAPRYDHAASTRPLLSVLHTGPRPPGPAELIASTRMVTLLTRWRKEFSFIVIDSPAARYADALVLAQNADAVLLAARANTSRRSEIVRALRDLRRHLPDRVLLGITLEEAPTGGPHAQA